MTAVSNVVAFDDRLATGRPGLFFDDWDEKTNRPTIRMRDGALHTIVQLAEELLIRDADPPKVYQRGPYLVRTVRTEADGLANDKVIRPRGALLITEVDRDWLRLELCRVGSWRKYRMVPQKGYGWIPSNPGIEYAQTLLKCAGSWTLPALRGISTCPIIDADGRVVQQPGYDAGTRMFLDFEAGDFATVPQSPTREDALAALEVFARPLRAIPFVSPEARSVALSAGLTVLARPSMRTAPLHAFDAPQPRTGKSLVATWASFIRCGVPPSVMHLASTDEEFDKRLSVALMAGDPVIMIDNIERPVEGETLCSALTEESVQLRILGESKRKQVPCASVILATGNNITLRGDVASRSLICRLNANCEFPGEREFGFDFKAEVARDRGALCVAGLTILRAWSAAGRPGLEKLKPMGGFEDWTAQVRGALVWLGEADPVATQRELVVSDERRDALREVMLAWEQALGDEAVDLKTVRTRQNCAALCELLQEVTEEREFNTKTVGYWIRDQRERIIDGRKFVSAGTTRSGAKLWRLAGAHGQVPLPDIDPKGF